MAMINMGLREQSLDFRGTTDSVGLRAELQGSCGHPHRDDAAHDVHQRHQERESPVMDYPQRPRKDQVDDEAHGDSSDRVEHGPTRAADRPVL